MVSAWGLFVSVPCLHTVRLPSFSLLLFYYYFSSILLYCQYSLLFNNPSNFLLQFPHFRYSLIVAEAGNGVGFYFYPAASELNDTKKNQELFLSQDNRDVL